MNDILSPDQIAQLVAAAERGELPAAQAVEARRTRRIRTIDFSRPTKLSPAEQRRFEQAHATFCRNASMRLTNELHAPIELEIINCDQLTWSGALRDLPQRSIYAVAALELPKQHGTESETIRAATGSHKTSIVICIEQPLVFRMIERLLGGTHCATLISRELTEIEAGLAARIMDSLLTPLSMVWDDLLGVTLILAGQPSQNVTIDIPPSDPALVLTIEVRDEGGTATMRLLVPHSAIAASSKRLSAVPADDENARQPSGEAVETMRMAMGAVDVELRAEVGAVELTIAEVLALAEGDTLLLSATGSEGVFIGEQRLTRTRPGRSGNRRAIQVIEPVEGYA